MSEIGHIPHAWRRTVINAEGTINRTAYTMCALDRLQSALRRCDIFAVSGERLSDRRMRLLEGRKWRNLCLQICRSLGRDVDGEQENSRLSCHLDATYRRAVSAFPSNDEVKGDTVYRRPTLTQLNHHENRHRLTRRIFFGKRCEVSRHYREGQEAQLSILGLVVNAIVLWNTIYMQEVIDQFREEGMAIDSDDIAPRQPHRYSNVNMLGRYAFNQTPEIAKGALRPLRDPGWPEL